MNIFEAWIIQVKEIEKKAILLNKSSGYKVMRFMRNIYGELRSGELKRVTTLTKRIGKFIIGDKSDMWEYNHFDPLVGIINDAQTLGKEMIDQKELFESINDDNFEKMGCAYDEFSFLDLECCNAPESNYPPPSGKRVAYFTNLLLDWEDRRPRFGGGERYCLTLSRLLEKLGFEVQLFQTAPTEFTGEYYGFPVKTIVSGEYYSEFNIDAANKFYEISKSYDYVIYNLPELSSAKMRPDAITICHGIWFDHNNYGGNIKFRKNKWFKYLYNAFNNPRHIVSVDTNSVNVIRVLWPELVNKMTFIPNFVDHKMFYPPKERKNKKITILFPRRSQINRGSRLLGRILEMVPHDVEFYWVGEGDDYDTKLILELVKKDSRLHYEKATFDEMPKWYQLADIAVIPTIACEGTSLSCIEAIASGCATIATNVGGLTDIIYDGVNGLSVNPTAEDIAMAINKLIISPELLVQLQNQGLNYSYNFSIEKWEEKWMNVLKKLGWIGVEKKKYCIITKNAIHGGVESLIALEAQRLDADIYVAGGLNNPEKTCPFKYKYINSFVSLLELLKNYDSVLYHWLPSWAVEAIKISGIPSVEFVHRVDTAECDKTVPTIIVSHSKYVCDYIKENFNRDCTLVPNVVDTDFYTPKTNKPYVIGAVTSYYETKGIDILVKAWAQINKKFPQYEFRLYGAGAEKEKFENLSKKLNAGVIFMGPIANSKIAYDEFRLVVSASRMEGLPIALLEALSCNIPILASDIEGHKVINQLAIASGLEPPIQLFENENATDLAEKLEKILHTDLKCDNRTVALKVFSPEQHINGLINALSSASVLQKHFPIASFAMNSIDNISVNIYDVSMQNSIETVLPYTITNQRYLIITIPAFKKKTEKIMIDIEINITKYCNIYMQMDSYINNKMVSSCEGIYLDKNVTKLHNTKTISKDTNENIKYIVRPNPGEYLEVLNVKVTGLENYKG